MKAEAPGEAGRDAAEADHDVAVAAVVVPADPVGAVAADNPTTPCCWASRHLLWRKSA